VYSLSGLGIILFLLFHSTIQISAQVENFIEIYRLPINTGNFNEFCPFIYNDGILFTSNKRTKSVISRQTDEGENLYKLFYASMNVNGKWKSPDLMDKALQSNYHDGPGTVSADGKYLYFTRNIQENTNNAPILGIFRAEMLDGEWVNASPLPINNPNYSTMHPSINRDGTILYFSSDMPGGYGGMDIYAVYWQDSIWSSPENLGSEINSRDNEVFPYIHDSGRLYFSSGNSDKPLDIFFSTKESSSYQTPVRLPAPINSAADDFGFIADSSFQEGYFSSNRHGSDDIFSFHSTFPEFENCESIRNPILCYEFYEENADSIDKDILAYEWDMGDGNHYSAYKVEHCFDTTGTYTIRLNVIDKLTGEISYNAAYYHFTIPEIEQIHLKFPDTIYAKDKIILNGLNNLADRNGQETLYWDLGDNSKKTGETIHHTFSSPGIYRIKLGVMTDPVKHCSYKDIVVLERNNGKP
jgi:hypothetical protein